MTLGGPGVSIMLATWQRGAVRGVRGGAWRGVMWQH